MRERKKILLINMSAIGDLVSSTVVIEQIIKKYGRVNIIVKRGFEQILLGHSNVVITSVAEAKNENWDIILDLTSSSETKKIVKELNGTKTIGMADGLISKIKALFIYNIVVPKKKYNNIVKDFFPILEKLGIFNRQNPTLEVEICETVDKIIQNKGSNITVIHIGAQNEKRRIPKKLIVDLVEYFKKIGLKVILLGTEKDIAKEILDETGKYPEYYELSLKEVKYLLSKVKFFIGSDSGMLHISSAVGTKSIGIYGPNLSKISGPLSEKTFFIEKDLECRPCRQSKKCLKNIKCMNSITVNEIIEVIDKKIDNLNINSN